MANQSLYMYVDDVLEIDYLVEEVSEDSLVEITKDPSDSLTKSYYSTSTFVFDPPQSGTYKLDLNGQIVEIDVFDIPNSVVVNAVASNYNGSKWVADIGPDLPDISGNPSKANVDINGDTVTVVRYNSGNNDASRSTASGYSLSSNSQAIVYTVINRVPEPSDYRYYVDGGESDEFTHNLDGGESGRPHRIRSIDSGVDITGNDADSEPHTFALEGNGDTFRLLRDKNEIIKDTNSGFDSLSGFSLSVRGDGNLNYSSSLDVVEYSILDNHTNHDLESEIDRQMTNHNI